MKKVVAKKSAAKTAPKANPFAKKGATMPMGKKGCSPKRCK